MDALRRADQIPPRPAPGRRRVSRVRRPAVGRGASFRNALVGARPHRGRRSRAAARRRDDRRACRPRPRSRERDDLHHRAQPGGARAAPALSRDGEDRRDRGADRGGEGTVRAAGRVSLPDRQRRPRAGARRAGGHRPPRARGRRYDLPAVIHPRIDELLDNVDSRYALVIVAAKRARQINNYHHQLGEGTFDEFPPLVESRSKNYLTMALEEVAEGKIKYSYKA